MDEKALQELQEQIFSLMKDSTKDLWKVEDENFLKELAEDVAREKILSATSDNPDEHKKNLEHLAVTLRGEIVRKELKIKLLAKSYFIKILETIIKTVAIPLLKSVIKAP